jgi:hypothetical protein
MSADDGTSSARTLTILDYYTFTSDTGSETNDELKRCAKAILREIGSTINSLVDPYEVSTCDLLEAMIEGSEKAGLSSGVRYAAAAIIVAYQKGRTPLPPS